MASIAYYLFNIVIGIYTMLLNKTTLQKLLIYSNKESIFTSIHHIIHGNYKKSASILQIIHGNKESNYILSWPIGYALKYT